MITVLVIALWLFSLTLVPGAILVAILYATLPKFRELFKR